VELREEYQRYFKEKELNVFLNEHYEECLLGLPQFLY